MANSQDTLWTPRWAVQPGEILLEVLEAHEMTQSELARRLDRPIKTVNEIINGKAAITSDTAIQLERVLGVSARFWTGLESLYRDSQARLQADAELSEKTNWLQGFPISDLVKHELIERGSSDAGTLESLLGFLGVSSPGGFERLSSAASYRKSPSFDSSPKAVGAWLRWGELIAADLETNRFDEQRFLDALELARPLTRQEPLDQAVKKVRSLSADAGVCVLVVPELYGARVSGAARWIAGRPVIQLSVRYKSNDHFWFTFYHESGHLMSRSRKRDFVDEFNLLENTESSDQEEEFANTFARDLLLQPAAYQEFVNTGDFSRAAVREFARSQLVAPGIVVGRLQRDRHIAQDSLNDLKRPVALAGG